MTVARAVGYLIGCTCAVVVLVGVGIGAIARPDQEVNYSSTQQLLEERYSVKWPESELLALAVYLAVEKHGGSVELTLAQIQVESSFKPRTSKSGAVGFMQVRPQFWHKSKECPYNVYDKYENVFAGVCILQHYRVKYGNIEDALVAYNVGPSAVETLAAGYKYRNKVLAEAGSIE